MFIRNKEFKTILAASLVLALPLVAQPLLSPVQAAPQKSAATKRNAQDPVVIMETSKGTIKMEIFKKDAPITSENFLDLVGKKFYDGLSFHRYEPGFVIQGGDPKGNGSGDYVDPKTHQTRNIPLEVKPDLLHDQGALAMARSNDPNSASCQFYITLDKANFLDGKYAVFGKVLDGMNVVLQLRQGDKINKVAIAQDSK